MATTTQSRTRPGGRPSLATLLRFHATETCLGLGLIVLAGGSTKPRDLPIPGRDAAGVEFAMDFLTQANRRAAGRTIEKRMVLVD